MKEVKITGEREAAISFLISTLSLGDNLITPDTASIGSELMSAEGTLGGLYTITD